MRRNTFTPPMVIAMIALLFATAGTATAAKLLTGKDIRNNSLTGIDVKNSTLTGADVKNGTIGPKDLSKAAKIAGPAGPKGDQGATGAKGDQGERGPSAAFIAADELEIVFAALPASHEILRLTLPAGKFTFTAKFSLSDTSGNAGTPRCLVADLIGADELVETLDQVATPLPAGASGARQYTLAGTIAHDVARPVVMRCEPEQGGNQDAMQARDIKLVATQVASVN